MTKTIHRLLAVAAVAALALSGPAQASTKFIRANITDASHIQNVASQAFIDTLAETSGGEITVQHHPGGDLGDWVGLFEPVMQGSIEMTQT